MKQDKEWLSTEVIKNFDEWMSSSDTSRELRDSIIELIDQLDDKEKPVIPQFVADERCYVGQTDAYQEARELVLKLEGTKEVESEKVVVSQEQANWLGRMIVKSNRQMAIWLAYKEWFIGDRDDIPFDLGSQLDGDSFNKAVWHGYEVEDAPKFLVRYTSKMDDVDKTFISFMHPDVAERAYGKRSPFMPNGVKSRDHPEVEIFMDKNVAQDVAELVNGWIEDI